MDTPYTPDQVKDIEKREADALAYLKENGLTPAASIQKVNVGGDIFADRLVPFLRDTKYSPVTSPIQKDDLKNDEKPSEETA